MPTFYISQGKKRDLKANAFYLTLTNIAIPSC